MAGGIQNLKLDSSSSTVQMNQIYPIPVQSYQPYQPYSQPYIVSLDNLILIIIIILASFESRKWCSTSSTTSRPGSCAVSLLLCASTVLSDAMVRGVIFSSNWINTFLGRMAKIKKTKERHFLLPNCPFYPFHHSLAELWFFMTTIQSFSLPLNKSVHMSTPYQSVFGNRIRGPPMGFYSGP